MIYKEREGGRWWKCMRSIEGVVKATQSFLSEGIFFLVEKSISIKLNFPFQDIGEGEGEG